MSEPSLDDQLKQAQIEKTRAESKKLEREAYATSTQLRNAFWSDAIKIVAGVILGVGGVIAAITQFEVADLKAKISQKELAQAEAAKAVAETSAKEAVSKRDAAIREREEAEHAVKELKTSLNKATIELHAANPDLVKSRLTYIQFRGNISRELINEFRQGLLKQSFNAPGAERVAGEYQNSVKYFSASDSADAERLAKSVEIFFASKGCPLKMRAVPAGSSDQNLPLEIWLTHDCK